MPLHTEVRRATEGDLGAIEALVSAAYGKYVERIGRKPRPMLTNYRTALAEHQVWVCERERVVVAVLELVPGVSGMLIQNIAVDPAHQRAGLGRTLMGFAETEARRQGHRDIRLYTNERFTENLAFYGGLGYRETHREPVGGTDLVHMTKSV